MQAYTQWLAVKLLNAKSQERMWAFQTSRQRDNGKTSQGRRWHWRRQLFMRFVPAVSSHSARWWNRVSFRRDRNQWRCPSRSITWLRRAASGGPGTLDTYTHTGSHTHKLLNVNNAAPPSPPLGAKTYNIAVSENLIIQSGVIFMSSWKELHDIAQVRKGQGKSLCGASAWQESLSVSVSSAASKGSFSGILWINTQRRILSS